MRNAKWEKCLKENQKGKFCRPDFIEFFAAPLRENEWADGKQLDLTKNIPAELSKSDSCPKMPKEPKKTETKSLFGYKNH